MSTPLLSTPENEQGLTNLEIATAVCKGANIWPRYPSLICSKTNTIIKVACIRCLYWEEQWTGRILGSGFYGSIRALATRIRFKGIARPLKYLYTLCSKCCDDLELYDTAEQDDEIRASITDKRPSHGSLVLYVPFKEIGRVLATEVIIIEGAKFKKLRLIGREGESREWFQWSRYLIPCY